MQTIQKPTQVIKQYTSYLFAGWTIIVLITLAYNMRTFRQDILREAVLQAKNYYELNMYYRVVLSEFGGMYVPIEKTKPNPFLAVPARDIVTITGQRLTLVNPAYLTRMVFDTIKSKSKLQIINKITSLKSLNPANMPDPWERQALLSFEQGKQETTEITVLNGRPYLRMIKPFLTEDSCLKCHGSQGYKTGDVRGGISIAIPLEFYYETEKKMRQATIATHGLLWLIVSFGLLVFARLTIRNSKAYEETKILALYDPLTKLANRRLLDIEFEKSFAKAKRYKNELSVIMADIDHFKEFNDSRGHESGDAVLIQIANILVKGIRETDLAVRYGGEEFFILLPQTNIGETRDIAERIRKEIELQTELTISMGIGAFHAEMANRDELVKQADEALYRAKRNGRNQVCA